MVTNITEEETAVRAHLHLVNILAKTKNKTGLESKQLPRFNISYRKYKKNVLNITTEI